MKTNIRLSASKISTITGDNKWSFKKDLLIDLLKQNHNEIYIKIKNSFDRKLKKSNENKLLKKILNKNINKLDIDSKINTLIKETLDKPIIDKTVKKDLIKKIDKTVNTKNDIKKLNIHKSTKKIIKQKIDSIISNINKEYTNLDNKSDKNINKIDEINKIDKNNKVDINKIKLDITKKITKKINNDETIKNKEKEIEKMNKEIDNNINEINKIIQKAKTKETIKRKIDKCNEINSDNIECKKKFVKLETDKEIIQRIEKSNKIDLSSKINIKSKDLKELNKKEDLNKKIENSNLTLKDKKAVQKSIQSETNKRYGTYRENYTVQYLKDKFKFKVKIDKRYIYKKIKTINNINFFIIGQIDGLYNDDTIIEIKNRTKRLFYRVYNYEKVQIMIYMYIYNLKKSKLVENLNNEINIIDLNYSEEYINKVLNHIYKFIQFYSILLTNIEYQRAVLLKDNNEFDLFYNKINYD